MKIGWVPDGSPPERMTIRPGAPAESFGVHRRGCVPYPGRCGELQEVGPAPPDRERPVFALLRLALGPPIEMRAPGNDALEGFRQPTDLVAAQGAGPASRLPKLAGDVNPEVGLPPPTRGRGFRQRPGG